MVRNIVANVIGRFWGIGVALAFVPVYIRLLGIEAYGLIAFYTTLVTVMGILDLGLTSTINRELARVGAADDPTSRAPDLVRTLEFLYWSIGAVFGAVIVLLAPTIGEHWIRAEHISRHTLVSTVRLMGLVFATQWPASFYAGGLLGLQRQVLANIVIALNSTLRFAGAAVILWRLSPTCEAFFWWQVLASVVGTASLAFCLWAQPELKGRARVRWSLLRDVSHYATGVAGISLLAVALTQADKLMLSKLVSLKEFAYYGLASQVASSLNYVVNPFIAGIFPALCAAASAKSVEKLRELFHEGAGLVGGAAVPVVVFFALFAPDILFAWQRDLATAREAGPILALLSAAALFSAILNMPYTLMLAEGRTRVPFMTNLLSLVVLIPMLFIAVPRWGARGAASTWLLVNVLTLAVLPFAVFRGVFRIDRSTWYLRSVLWPILCAAIPLLFIRFVVFRGDQVVGLLGLFLTALTGGLAGLLSVPPARRWLSLRAGAWSR